MVENYKLELNTLMREMKSEQPLLVLSCCAKDENNPSARDRLCPAESLSCMQLVEVLQLYDLGREWLVIDCNVLQRLMKDIVLGFEWILNQLECSHLNKIVN